MRERIPDPCDERIFLASKLNWRVIDQAPTSVDFRSLTQRLLRLRREKIVPLIKRGFTAAKADLLGTSDASGGIDVRWQTAKHDHLQIVANFSDGDLPMPTLIDGKTLWPQEAARQDMLPPARIIVRLHSDTNPR
jgi:maltooligosyltrehalose trehalohydrolase